MKSFKKTFLMLSIIMLLLTSAFSPVFAASKAGSSISAGCVLSPGERQSVTFFIQNEEVIDHSYTLTISGMANSYDWFFSKEGSSIRQITVAPGQISRIDLNLSLTGSAVASEDRFLVKAIRDDGKENNIPLTVAVNKDYKLSVRSMVSKIDLLNGAASELTFAVVNEGSKEIKSVNLISELPYKWIASQSPSAGVDIKPGETGLLKLTVEVPASQASGNFTAKFTAVSTETKSEQISLPITVKTSTSMAYYMGGALLIIAAFTLYQFRKHGRR